MSDETLPEPFTTAEHDIAGFDGFMLDTDRLLSSELWALATGDEFKAAMALWCRAWKQVPAGSLPDDEKVLAAFSGAGAKWSKVRTTALRGFVKCSDSRLYHTFLCRDVVRAAESKLKRKERTKAATEARKKERDIQRNDQRDVDETPNVTTSHRQDRTGQEVKKEEDTRPPAREVLAELEFKLREAAGWQHKPAPNLFVTGPIHALIEAGADLELDVLPTIRAIAPRVPRPNSWNYFVDAIAQARDDRLAAGNLKFEGKPHARTTHKPNSIAGAFSIVNAQIAAITEDERREAELSGTDDGEDAQGVPRLRQIAP